MKKFLIVPAFLTLAAALAWSKAGFARMGAVDYYTDGQGKTTRGYFAGAQYYYEDTTGQTLTCSRSKKIYLCR